MRRFRPSPLLVILTATMLGACCFAIGTIATGGAPPAPPAPPRPTLAATSAPLPTSAPSATAVRVAATRAPAAPTGDQSPRAFVECKRFVTERIKSPSTAEFGSYLLGDVDVARVGDTYTVSSFVDAQNALGATVRTRFVCVVTPGEPNQLWTLINLDVVQ